jgi:hypothetical protein
MVTGKGDEQFACGYVPHATSCIGTYKIAEGLGADTQAKSWVAPTVRLPQIRVVPAFSSCLCSALVMIQFVSANVK